VTCVQKDFTKIKMAVQHVLNVHQGNINSNKVKKLAMIVVRGNFPLQATLQVANPVQ
jgi:hypothetical protein